MEYIVCGMKAGAMWHRPGPTQEESSSRRRCVHPRRADGSVAKHIVVSVNRDGNLRIEASDPDGLDALSTIVLNRLVHAYATIVSTCRGRIPPRLPPWSTRCTSTPPTSFAPSVTARPRPRPSPSATLAGGAVMSAFVAVTVDATRTVKQSIRCVNAVENIAPQSCGQDAGRATGESPARWEDSKPKTIAATVAAGHAIDSQCGRRSSDSERG